MIDESDNKSIEVIDKVLINEPDNKSINKSDNKSINELDNSIKGNTISEADAKREINELNEIKKSRNKR